MESPAAGPVIERHTFDKYQIRSNIAIPKDLLEQAPLAATNMEVFIEKNEDLLKGRADSLVLSVLTWVLSGKAVKEDRTFITPKTWWDHFKRDSRFFPKCLRRRFPPQYDKHTFETLGIINVCPHSTEKWSTDRLPHIKFLSVDPRAILKERRDQS